MSIKLQFKKKNYILCNFKTECNNENCNNLISKKKLSNKKIMLNKHLCCIISQIFIFSNKYIREIWTSCSLVHLTMYLFLKHVETYTHYSPSCTSSLSSTYRESIIFCYCSCIKRILRNRYHYSSLFISPLSCHT